MVPSEYPKVGLSNTATLTLNIYNVVRRVRRINRYKRLSSCLTKGSGVARKSGLTSQEHRFNFLQYLRLIVKKMI